MACLLILNDCKCICMKQLTLLYFSRPYFPTLLGYEFFTGLPGQDTNQVSPMKQWNNWHYCIFPHHIFPFFLDIHFLSDSQAKFQTKLRPWAIRVRSGVHPAITATGIEWVRGSSVLVPIQTTYFSLVNNGSSRSIVYHLILNLHSIY